MSRTRSPLVAALFLVAVIGFGCDSPEDRAEHHIERADELFAEGRKKEGLLELHSAARLAPDDTAITLRVAQASLSFGYRGDAINFYRDVVSQRPDDTDTALRLARLLYATEPEEADALIDRVSRMDPTTAEPFLIRSRAALEAGDTSKAMVAARRAHSRGIDNPKVYWHLALAHEARLSEFLRKTYQRTHVDHLFSSTLKAYDDYLSRGGEKTLLAELGKAGVLSRWKGKEIQARAAFRKLLRMSRGSHPSADKLQALGAVEAYGRRQDDQKLQRDALRRVVEIAPDRLQAWRSLASLTGRNKELAKIYREMIAAQPESAGAHILMAQHVDRVRGLSAATQYLRTQLDKGIDPPVLLAAIADLQIARKNPSEAAFTISELNDKYPDNPTTMLFVARNAFIEQDYPTALKTLDSLIERHETPRAQLLLARTRYYGEDFEGALSSLNRAIALEPESAQEARRFKVQMLHERGDCKRALVALKTLERKHSLHDPDTVVMASCLYETGVPALGRMRLVKLLDRGRHMTPAALELQKREKGVASFEPRLNAYLKKAYRADRDNDELLEAVTTIDMLEGHQELAVARLDGAIALDHSRATAFLLRSAARLQMGRLAKAKTDAERVFLHWPAYREPAIQLLTRIYARAGDLGKALASIERRARAQSLEPDYLVLLGRLYSLNGDAAKALAAFEQALANGSQLKLLKVDLAFMLASIGKDLERAQVLAQQAADAAGDDLYAVDTLGFVYLQSGNPEAALWQFRFATQNADPPVAQYYFHLGLAHEGLSQPDDAKKAFERALEIDPQFAEASDARKHLELLRTASGGSPTDPS